MSERWSGVGGGGSRWGERPHKRGRGQARWRQTAACASGLIGETEPNEPAQTQPASSAEPVTVTVRSLAGEVLLGPEELPSALRTHEIKDRLRAARPGSGVRLLCGARELADGDSLGAAGIKGDVLDLTVVLSKTFSVVSWGEATYGGRAPPEVGSGVLKLYSSTGAFAVIKEGGAVSAWGHPAYGGDVSAAAPRLLSGVESITAGKNAFVALKKDGSMVAWGNARFGGRGPRSTPNGSKNVFASVHVSGEAFAALTKSGSVVTWGMDVFGGDSSAVAHELCSGVVELFSTGSAFAALKEGGRVVTWGLPSNGGDSSLAAAQLASGVKTIFSNITAFAALTDQGAVVTWGNRECGGHAGAEAPKLEGGVVTVFSSGSAFCALKEDGSTVTWGRPGEPAAMAEHLAGGGRCAKTNGSAVALVLDGGRLELRGDPRSGGDCGHLLSRLREGVTAVETTQGAFAVLKEDGSVVAWGRHQLGGDCSSVAEALSCGAVALHSTQSAFAVLKQVTKE